MTDQRYCVTCGAAVGARRFCTQCGTPVVPTPEPATAATPAAPAAARTSAATATPQRRRRRRRSRTPLVLTCVAVALLVGVVAFVVGSVVHGEREPVITADEAERLALEDSARAVEPTDATQPTGEQVDPATGTSDAPSAEATPTQPLDEEQAAEEVAALITVSASDKSSIATAAANLDACRDIASSVATFDAAAASRARLVEQVTALDVSALPNGAALVRELERAWRASQAADEAYVRWGGTLERTRKGCRGDAAALREATALSASSHPHKRAAARLWRPIAERHGLLRVGWRQL